MRLFSVPAFVSLAMLLATGDAYSAPTDLQGISAASKAISDNAHLEGSDAKQELLGVFTNLIVHNAIVIGDAQGISEKAKLRSTGFHGYVKKRVLGRVEKVARIEDKDDRTDEWYALLRLTSSTNEAHHNLARWLDFKKPGAYLSKIRRGSPPRVSAQITTSSSDGRLKFVDNGVKLGAEMGGAGEGNGVLDAGEWVQLQVGVYNNDARPFFSSSAWVQSGHACAWVRPAEEIVMAELPAKVEETDEEDHPSQGLESWVYLSNSCADGARVPLNVQIKDTHRASAEPIVLALTLKVANRTNGRAAAFMVDTDVPGMSDGRKMREVRASREFEISHGWAVNPKRVLSARSGWGVHEDLASVVDKQAPALEPMFAAEPGYFLPGDDYDFEMVKPSDYDRILQGVADNKEWTELDDSRAWFATDTEVLFETPDPPMNVAEVIADEVCDNYLDDDGDGKHDCQDSDCKTDKACNLPTPPAFEQLLNIFKGNMSIEANPASPTLTGAVLAVEPGYELVVNQKKIQTQYACVVAGIPADQCEGCALYGLSLEECGQCLDAKTPLAKCGAESCDEPEVEDEPEGDDSGRDAAVAYTYRSYFTVPLNWNPTESDGFGNCDDDRDNDLDGLTDEQDTDCSSYVVVKVKPERPVKVKEVREPRDPHGHRLDVGIVYSRVVLTDTDNLVWGNLGQPVLSKSFRYVFNYKTDSMVRPMFAFDQSSSYPILNNGDTYQSQTMGGGVQLNFDLSIDGLAIQPHLLVKQLMVVDIYTGYGADVGAEVHYATPFGVGVYLGGAYMNRPSLPGKGGTDAIKHSVVGANAGLTYALDF